MMRRPLTVTVLRYNPGGEVVAKVGPARCRAFFSHDGQHVTWECSICGRGKRPSCAHTAALAATDPAERNQAS